LRRPFANTTATASVSGVLRDGVMQNAGDVDFRTFENLTGEVCRNPLARG
jgi:hypothetical protein